MATFADGAFWLACLAAVKRTKERNCSRQKSEARATRGHGALAIMPEGRAAQARLVADGRCSAEPTPFLSVLDELCTIEISDDDVVMRFDITSDDVVRTIHMGAEHFRMTKRGHPVDGWTDRRFAWGVARKVTRVFKYGS